MVIATSYKAVPEALVQLEQGSGGGRGGNAFDDDGIVPPPPPVGAVILVLPPLEVPLKQDGIGKLRKALAGDGGEYPREIGINGTGSQSIVVSVQSTKRAALMVADADAVDVKIYPDFEQTLGALEIAVRYELLEFHETVVEQTDATTITAVDGGMHKLHHYGVTWRVGAPAVGAHVDVADEHAESNWSQHIVQSVAKKTFKVKGNITGIKIEECVARTPSDPHTPTYREPFWPLQVWRFMEVHCRCRREACGLVVEATAQTGKQAPCNCDCRRSQHRTRCDR